MLNLVQHLISKAKFVKMKEILKRVQDDNDGKFRMTKKKNKFVEMKEILKQVQDDNEKRVQDDKEEVLLINLPHL